MQGGGTAVMLSLFPRSWGDLDRAGSCSWRFSVHLWLLFPPCHHQQSLSFASSTLSPRCAGADCSPQPQTHRESLYI